MSDVPCFWVEPTGEARYGLRRYEDRTRGLCPGGRGYHDASVVLEGLHPVARTPDGYIAALPDDLVSHDDPRWPTKCAACSYEFVEADQWQVNIHEGWRRPDTGEVIAWDLFGITPGAMWDAFWMGDDYRGPDGLHLTVQLPDGLPWAVDGPTSNSTPEHRRGWTRTGDPKAVPPTVSATPSILTPGYHGFLTNGHLTSV